MWIKPALMCLVSIALVYATRFADQLAPGLEVPPISLESVVTLLKILASGMLVIATLAVASMVSSYNSASTTATPRAFPLIVGDDLSQFALSTFVGAFIFSVITLIAVENSYYGKQGLFAVMALTLAVFALVLLTFVRWVDGIARLGLLGNTVKKVEKVTESALRARLKAPTMGGREAEESGGEPVFGERIGYVQLIDMEALQRVADDKAVHIRVVSLPGRLVMPGRALVALSPAENTVETGDNLPDIDEETRSDIVGAFVIGDERTFDEDPRFGLVALAQIGCRAMSPAINDPGTVIDIIPAFVRLFVLWCEDHGEKRETEDIPYPGVAVPRLSLDAMLEDAFCAIGRDGAANVEVAVRLQDAFSSLSTLGDESVRQIVRKHAGLALARAEQALQVEQDLAAVREASIVK